MGYHWHPRMQAWVRTCESLVLDEIIVHIVTNSDFNGRVKQPPEMHDHHRCWWEHMSTLGDPFRLTELAAITRVKRSFVVSLDNDGRVLWSRAGW